MTPEQCIREHRERPAPGCACCEKRMAQWIEATAARVADLLRPLIVAKADEWDTDDVPHEHVRAAVRAALRKLGTYDAAGCPLCLG